MPAPDDSPPGTGPRRCTGPLLRCRASSSTSSRVQGNRSGSCIRSRRERRPAFAKPQMVQLRLGAGELSLQPCAVEAEHALGGRDLKLVVALKRAVEIVGRNPAFGVLEQQEGFGSGRGEAGELCQDQHDLVALLLESMLDRVDL